MTIDTDPAKLEAARLRLHEYMAVLLPALAAKCASAQEERFAIMVEIMGGLRYYAQMIADLPVADLGGPRSAFELFQRQMQRDFERCVVARRGGH